MENKNENVLTYDKDKFKKRFTTFYKITNFVEKFLLGSALFCFIAILLLGILVGTSLVTQEEAQEMYDGEILNLDNSTFFSADNLVEMLEIEDEEDINSLKELETDHPKLFSTLFKLLFVVFYILEFTKVFIIVFILKKLKTLFKNTADNLTPFTEENVKCMNKLFVLLIVYWLLTATTGLLTSLVYIISIVAINYMFKYGYELQKESDELL